VFIVPNDCDKLGGVIKEARVANRLTQKQLAARLDISTHYLLSIEKNRKKPSYDLLFRTIRVLSIPADKIFYPEFIQDEHEVQELRRLLAHCSENESHLVNAALRLITKKE